MKILENDMTPNNILILGAGSFGTAMASALARGGHPVVLYCRTAEQAQHIHDTRQNPRYFPGQMLDDRINVTCSLHALERFKIIFLAFPARHLDYYAKLLRDRATPGTIIVNLVKGLHARHFTFASLFAAEVPHVSYVALKGPTFAKPMFHGEVSGLTCGTENAAVQSQIAALFCQSAIDLDFCASASAVDAVSALKNVYALALGIGAALGFSENTTFLMVSRIVREIDTILREFGYEEVLLTYSGIGDTLLTGLCDTSRNRTIGFMLGKGLRIDGDGSGFLAEGVKALSILYKRVEGVDTPLLRRVESILVGHAEPLTLLEGLKAN